MPLGYASWSETLQSFLRGDKELNPGIVTTDKKSACYRLVLSYVAAPSVEVNRAAESTVCIEYRTTVDSVWHEATLTSRDPSNANCSVEFFRDGKEEEDGRIHYASMKYLFIHLLTPPRTIGEVYWLFMYAYMVHYTDVPRYACPWNVTNFLLGYRAAAMFHSLFGAKWLLR
jgi:hypothetical protein